MPSLIPTVSVGEKGAMRGAKMAIKQQDGEHDHADDRRALVDQFPEGGGPQAAGLGEAGGLAALVGRWQVLRHGHLGVPGHLIGHPAGV